MLAPAQIANLPAGRVVVIRRGIAPVIGRAQMAWKRRDVRRRARLLRRIEAESRWHRRGEATRVWADGQLERLLVLLAARWPERYGEAAERVRSSNRMFAELRAIRRGTEHGQAVEATALHEPGPDGGRPAGPVGGAGDGRWT